MILSCSSPYCQQPVILRQLNPFRTNKPYFFKTYFNSLTFMLRSTKCPLFFKILDCVSYKYLIYSKCVTLPLDRIIINYLTPNDPYMGRTAPLTFKRCILYIYSTNRGTEYFKHALKSPSFLFKMQFVS